MSEAPDEDYITCGELYDHDEEVVWEDSREYQWRCKRCEAEGFVSKEAEDA